jgi:hypothetical protein
VYEVDEKGRCVECGTDIIESDVLRKRIADLEAALVTLQDAALNTAVLLDQTPQALRDAAFEALHVLEAKTK